VPEPSVAALLVIAPVLVGLRRRSCRRRLAARSLNPNP